MKKIVSLLFLIFFYANTLLSQVGIGTNTPAPSAQLDVSSTERGFLPPRMTAAQRDLITTPASGLLIYQTDNSAGYYYYNGSAWVGLGGTSGSNGVSIGQMNYWNGSAWVQIPQGTQGQNLTLCDGIPTWGPCLASLSTIYTSTTSLQAIVGGNITADGNSPVIQRGVCYGLNPNPTISGSITNNGNGIGTFTSNLSGLTASTLYYVRAYATTSAGTSYGNQLTFTTNAPFSLNGGTITNTGFDKVHTFTSSGTLSITGSGVLSVLVVGGGANGLSFSGGSGKGGNGGQVVYNTSFPISSGTYSINVGGINGASSFSTLTAVGGGGAVGGNGGNTDSWGGNGINGTSNSITGVNLIYGSSGGGGANTWGGPNYTGGTGGLNAGNGGSIVSSAPTSGGNATFYGSGGGGGSVKQNTGSYGWYGNGYQGIVIIRYTP
jgi:hypothetical protein